MLSLTDDDDYDDESSDDDDDGDDDDDDDICIIGFARIKWFSSETPTQCKESFQLIATRFMLIKPNFAAD